MKNKDQIKLISAMFIAPFIVNAKDINESQQEEFRNIENHGLIFPNEKLIISRPEGQYSITHKRIIQQIKKQVEVNEDIPLEIFIHEESTNIDINLGDISITVPIEKASKNIPNVITRTTNGTELSL